MRSIKVIKSLEQYNAYCDELERLTSLPRLSVEDEEQVELLSLLIEKWDETHMTSEALHPVELLKQLMDMHDVNAAELSKNTGIDKTVLSKIINNKKSFSKDVIRALAIYFKVKQEAFNKPYAVGESSNSTTRKSKTTLSLVKDKKNKYPKLTGNLKSKTKVTSTPK